MGLIRRIPMRPPGGGPLPPDPYITVWAEDGPAEFDDDIVDIFFHNGKVRLLVVNGSGGLDFYTRNGPGDWSLWLSDAQSRIAYWYVPRVYPVSASVSLVVSQLTGTNANDRFAVVDVLDGEALGAREHTSLATTAYPVLLPVGGSLFLVGTVPYGGVGDQLWKVTKRSSLGAPPQSWAAQSDLVAPNLQGFNSESFDGAAMTVHGYFEPSGETLAFVSDPQGFIDSSPGCIYKSQFYAPGPDASLHVKASKGGSWSEILNLSDYEPYSVMPAAGGDVMVVAVLRVSDQKLCVLRYVNLDGSVAVDYEGSFGSEWPYWAKYIVGDGFYVVSADNNYYHVYRGQITPA